MRYSSVSMSGKFKKSILSNPIHKLLFPFILAKNPKDKQKEEAEAGDIDMGVGRGANKKLRTMDEEEVLSLCLSLSLLSYHPCASKV